MKLKYPMMKIILLNSHNISLNAENMDYTKILLLIKVICTHLIIMQKNSISLLVLHIRLKEKKNFLAMINRNLINNEKNNNVSMKN